MKTALKTSIAMIGLAAGLSIGGIAQAKDTQSNSNLPKQFQGNWSAHKNEDGIGFGSAAWGYGTTVCEYTQMQVINKDKVIFRSVCHSEGFEPTASEIKRMKQLPLSAKSFVTDKPNEEGNRKVEIYLVADYTLTLKGKNMMFESNDPVVPSRLLKYRYQGQ